MCDVFDDVFVGFVVKQFGEMVGGVVQFGGEGIIVECGIVDVVLDQLLVVEGVFGFGVEVGLLFFDDGDEQGEFGEEEFFDGGVVCGVLVEMQVGDVVQVFDEVVEKWRCEEIDVVDGGVVGW